MAGVTEERQVLKRAVHPGQILSDELAELGVTATELPARLKCPPTG